MCKILWKPRDKVSVTVNLVGAVGEKEVSKCLHAVTFDPKWKNSS
jgi:hypothetical protein